MKVSYGTEVLLYKQQMPKRAVVLPTRQAAAAVAWPELIQNQPRVEDIKVHGPLFDVLAPACSAFVTTSCVTVPLDLGLSVTSVIMVSTALVPAALLV